MNQMKKADAIIAEILERHIDSGQAQFLVLGELAAQAVYAMAAIFHANEPAHPECLLCPSDAVSARAHKLAGVPGLEKVQNAENSAKGATH